MKGSGSVKKEKKREKKENGWEENKGGNEGIGV
jgi:hypothetical protein